MSNEAVERREDLIMELSNDIDATAHEIAKKRCKNSKWRLKGEIHTSVTGYREKAVSCGFLNLSTKVITEAILDEKTIIWPIELWWNRCYLSANGQIGELNYLSDVSHELIPLSEFETDNIGQPGKLRRRPKEKVFTPVNFIMMDARELVNLNESLHQLLNEDV